ncbi:Crp/Fnr family transcriptional regulator [Chryseobacterium sp. ISL-6]|uniref:Crp/Fnr family transcriptional regulator n=1 Tax=Chryseobacterium sp. ISL-6 TaxID=2819143 RepID=UPI001BE80226|nr:Crp/Fnr family transcriptional regulator [Chryseobacterium sp. ISL-6]MBT2622667.1 Crp/Fnr family transcriptional regulator [Chryseobacterium sp. ISL-6]
MEKLRSSLSFGGILSQESIDHVSLLFKKNELKANEHFQQIDGVSNKIGFVENGIIRGYSIDKNDTEVTKYFVRESQFFVDLESYYASLPSKDAFQAVTDSTIYSIQKSVIEKLSEDLPNFYIYLKSITEAQLLNKLKDNDFLNYGDAKTKYLEFISRYPILALQVPQQYIASYLKITPQSLSRIRNIISKKSK